MTHDKGRNIYDCFIIHNISDGEGGCYFVCWEYIKDRRTCTKATLQDSSTTNDICDQNHPYFDNKHLEQVYYLQQKNAIRTSTILEKYSRIALGT